MDIGREYDEFFFPLPLIFSTFYQPIGGNLFHFSPQSFSASEIQDADKGFHEGYTERVTTEICLHYRLIFFICFGLPLTQQTAESSRESCGKSSSSYQRANFVYGLDGTYNFLEPYAKTTTMAMRTSLQNISSNYL